MTHVYNTDPLQVHRHYEIDYIHSYGEVSDFFIALKKKKLISTPKWPLFLADRPHENTKYLISQKHRSL